MPERKCVSCGRVRPKRELLRITKQKNGAVLVDETGKAEGRGAYLCREASCLEAAKRKGALSRSFRMAVDPALYDALAAGVKDGNDT